MSRSAERQPVGDPNDPRGFESLIARYLEWLEVHQYSPITVVSGRNALLQFATWCATRGIGRPAEVALAVLERYQRFLFHYRRGDGRPLAFSSQRTQLDRVRVFFKWLAREHYLQSDPASGLLIPQKPPRLPTEVFSPAEVEQILATLDVSTALGLRDRAIVETFYSTGIRRRELVGLDLFDLDTERGWLTVRRGKGDKSRVVPIGERALAWVVRYLEQARPELVLAAHEPALFVSAQGGRLDPDAVGNRVRTLIETSGVRGRVGSCHLFRHTCATLMLEGGADIRYVQEMLGHAHLATTEIYTRVSIQKLKEIHTATHPAARLEPSEATAELLAALAAEAANERS